MGWHSWGVCKAGTYKDSNMKEKGAVRDVVKVWLFDLDRISLQGSIPACHAVHDFNFADESDASPFSAVKSDLKWSADPSLHTTPVSKKTGLFKHKDQNVFRHNYSLSIKFYSFCLSTVIRSNWTLPNGGWRSYGSWYIWSRVEEPDMTNASPKCTQRPIE